MHWQAKDPVSCYSHLLGVGLSITGLVTLLVESQGDPRRVVAFSMYGASLILLYSASTIYHWRVLPPRGEDILKRLDHLAIFVLIAGTYTPVCLVTLRGGWERHSSSSSDICHAGSRRRSTWAWGGLRSSPSCRWRKACPSAE